VRHGIALRKRESLQAVLDVDDDGLGELVDDVTLLEVPLSGGRRYVRPTPCPPRRPPRPVPRETSAGADPVRTRAGSRSRAWRTGDEGRTHVQCWTQTDGRLDTGRRTRGRGDTRN
jgi:hypothetical protein